MELRRWEYGEWYAVMPSAWLEGYRRIHPTQREPAAVANYGHGMRGRQERRMRKALEESPEHGRPRVIEVWLG